MMHSKTILTCIVMLQLLCLFLTPTPVHGQQHQLENWWQAQSQSVFDRTRLANKMARVDVQGNRFVIDNHEIVFRGVNIADPDKLLQQQQWNKSIFEAIAGWHANIVRIPVHPIAWRQQGHQQYLKLLDQAIYWANSMNLYVIIDWHSIGNLQQELFQAPMYDTNQRETLNFWRQVSQRYSGVNTVAFYEVFNEPTDYNGRLGTLNWQDWKQINEIVIDLIQAYDDEVITLVAGLDWAYDLRPVANSPIARDRIAYVTHPYPQKRPRPFVDHWQQDFGFVAKRYPLIATEIGYMAADEPGAHIPVIDENDYGPSIVSYLDDLGASWLAWCFDPEWTPQLISDWQFTPTKSGNVFKNAMAAEARQLPNKNQLSTPEKTN